MIGLDKRFDTLLSHVECSPPFGGCFRSQARLAVRRDAVFIKPSAAVRAGHCRHRSSRFGENASAGVFVECCVGVVDSSRGTRRLQRDRTDVKNVTAVIPENSILLQELPIVVVWVLIGSKRGVWKILLLL